MKKLEYSVRFVTPAFLGDAFQNGQWRTPPFKALLRQWWRVAEVAGKLPVMAAIHCREGELFGRAADQGTTSSQVRLRLDWRGGTSNAQGWQRYVFGSVTHPEVAQRPGVDLYLGYGPVDVGNRLKRETYLPPGQSRTLILSIPSPEDARFREVLRLAHAFGSLGSRSRNGWGSLHFEHNGLSTDELKALLEPANREGRNWLRAYSRPWEDCLEAEADWCHAIGRDSPDDKGLLLWRTETMDKWEDVLKTFAEVKIAFRTVFHFKGAGPHADLCDRQLLAYPVTKHSLGTWGNDARSANQILFKVLPLDNRFVGLVVHLPHGLPVPLINRLSESDRTGLRGRREGKVWAQVHTVLDSKLTRLP